MSCEEKSGKSEDVASPRQHLLEEEDEPATFVSSTWRVKSIESGGEIEIRLDQQHLKIQKVNRKNSSIKLNDRRFHVTTALRLERLKNSKFKCVCPFFRFPPLF